MNISQKHYRALPGKSHEASHYRGFSMVELLIAMVIGMTLMAGILQVAVSSKKNHVVGEGLARLQENGRFAIDVMTNDIREAGYIGYAVADGSITPNVWADPAPPFPFDADNMLRGYHWDGTNWSPSTPASSGDLGTVVDDTDVLVIQYGGSCGGQLIKTMVQAVNSIKINQGNSCNLTAGSVAVISNFSSMDVFRVSSTNNTGAAIFNILHTSSGNPKYNTGGNLSTKYTTESEILVVQSFTYFLRDGAGGSPSLWRLNNNQATSATNPEELVEGVEDMEILYGVDDDAIDTTGYGTADQYVDANGVGAAGGWVNVVTVRLALLMKTTSDVLDTAQDYTFLANTSDTAVSAASTTTATDLAVRRTLSATIQLRNRGLQ